MAEKPKVLLTASYGPNELGWGQDMFDLTASRLLRGHGPFQITSHMHHAGLYLIAENISNPTTVLEHPHWEEFDAELDKGYDVIGFQLKSVQTAKIARMMKRIREKSPESKIVVGGYGVGTLNNPVPGDKNGDAVYIRENADYLCREEGVRFMRKLLNDTPVDREITQYHLPMCGVRLSGLEVANARAPMLLVSLGCPNACDFCNTSAFFRHKKIYVAEPEQIYRYIRRYQRRLGFRDMFVLLFDEDFFLNVDYVNELGRLLRSKKKTWGVRYFTFGSVRSLSNFTAEELRDNGLGVVWIGVESFQLHTPASTEVADERYNKRKGKQEIKELFEDLHRHDIHTIGSLVLGFDFHTPENMKEDIDRFVELHTLAYQISPLTPCPGTALYDRMIEEGRILDTFRWEDIILWKDDVFEIKNFRKGDIKKYFDYAHEKIRDEVGPQPLQVMEFALDSYQTYKDRTDDFHAYQADQLRYKALAAGTYVRAIIKHHQSAKVRERAAMLEKRAKTELKTNPLVAAGLSLASRLIENQIKKKVGEPPEPKVSDPPPRWTYYHTFDDRVWVRRGRTARRPVPYKDKGILGLGKPVTRMVRSYGSKTKGSRIKNFLSGL